MSSKSERAAEKAEALARLQEWLKPGDTVYTIMRSVSRSGMSRKIGVVLLKPTEGERAPLIDLHPNHAVSRALGVRLAPGAWDAVVINGCGMDMGFHLVHELSYALFPSGFGCIGEGCPSNDHSNGDRDYTPHCSVHKSYDHGAASPAGARCDGDHWHKSGAFALRQRRL